MIHNMSPALRLLACVALMAPAAQAQTSSIDPSNGMSVRADAADGATVRLNGRVVNAASGPGAVAETNIGSRTITSRGEGDKSSTVTIDGNGATTTVTTCGATAAHGGCGAAGGRDFVNTDLSGRNFAGANFAGRRFTNVDLSRANLQGADLRGARLTNVDLAGANLSGANLAGAKLVNTDVSEAITAGMIWDGHAR